MSLLVLLTHNHINPLLSNISKDRSEKLIDGKNVVTVWSGSPTSCIIFSLSAKEITYLIAAFTNKRAEIFYSLKITKHFLFFSPSTCKLACWDKSICIDFYTAAGSDMRSNRIICGTTACWNNLGSSLPSVGVWFSPFNTSSPAGGRAQSVRCSHCGITGEVCDLGTEKFGLCFAFHRVTGRRSFDLLFLHLEA